MRLSRAISAPNAAPDGSSAALLAGCEALAPPPAAVPAVGPDTSKLSGGRPSCPSWPEGAPRGDALVGTRVRVYWEDDEEWFVGEVINLK